MGKWLEKYELGQIKSNILYKGVNLGICWAWPPYEGKYEAFGAGAAEAPPLRAAFIKRKA